MMNDTVREELAGKIGRGSGRLNGSAPALEKEKVVEEPVREKTPAPTPAPALAAPPKRVLTTELPPKRTSKTLVDFQPKNPTLPDWRLQIQNTVRKRSGSAVRELAVATAETAAAVQQQAPPTAREISVSRPEPVTSENSTVANALKRIEASRKAFLPPAAKAANGTGARPAAPQRSYPFNVVTRTAAAKPAKAEAQAQAKPKLVSSLRIEKRSYDTNKLPPLPKPAELSSSFVSGELFPETEPELEIKNEIVETPIDELEAVAAIEEQVEAEELYIEEIDDLAPFSMRFAAGFFDFVIATCGAMITLSPFMVSGGSWISLSGILAIVATIAIFLFLYLTASIGFWGKTLGMRIFSLELIDIDGNEYPTVHQAAVNSAVYLLSMAFGGAGFLTLLINQEKRAFHDIVSGTLMIRDI